MPTPRELPQNERVELQKQIADRFGQTVDANAEYRAAGSFRFVDTARFLYLDRTDLGSIGIETPQYGRIGPPLTPRDLDRNMLLGRVEAALTRARVDAVGRNFEAFNDEFAGAAQPSLLPAGFDPRQASSQVARTVSFGRRTPEGITVFGSELIVGLMPDESIGRLRLHWPRLEQSLTAEAGKLQELVRAKSWSLPEAMREPGVTVVAQESGVAHSGFADPGFRSRAVVRVTYRKASPDREYPTSSTGYKYFDASGREVQLTAFPVVAGTEANRKQNR